MIRLPKNYYEFSDCYGESNECIHAGSYHKALDMAGIHNYNIIPYSSIMPYNATKVGKVPRYKMGTVIEGIFATCSGDAPGETLSAGVAYRFIRKGKKRVGGIAVERTGDFSELQLRHHLSLSLDEIKDYSFKDFEWDGEATMLTSVFIHYAKYGTAFAGLAFTSFNTVEFCKTNILKL